MTRPLLIAAAVLALACGQKPKVETFQKPPGLEALPAQVALRCVTPGCETVETIRVNVVGSRRLAIKRILISGDAASEFRFETAEPAPFILGPNTGFEVTLAYTPTGAPVAGSIELRVTYTDASPEEGEDRVEAGELIVPLVRRLVGEPELVANPGALSFGFVAQGSSKSLPLHVENAGFGNIALELTGADAGHASVRAILPGNATLAPGAALDFPVLFAPEEETYVRTLLALESSAPKHAQSAIQIEATSIPGASIALAPEGDLDFGEVARGSQRTLGVEVVNRGGTALVLNDLHLSDPSGNLELQEAPGAALTLQPLQRLPIVFRVNALSPSEVNATVEVASNDPVRPLIAFRIKGTITEPRVTLAPGSIDFGAVPVGWVVKQPVEIRNTGFGSLTVKNIRMVGGSSNLFTISGLPALPVLLGRDERIAVEVEFRAETQGPFSGALSVESNDPVSTFSEVPLQATAGSCATSCPISNGTPSCSAGTCGVGSCDTGWFDTDGSASNGCECKEIGTDPSAFCSGAKYVGELVDNNADQATFTGVLPVDGDEDVIRFFAKDEGGCCSDKFRVRVSLSSSDSNIDFCVYRKETGSHSSECYWTNESCPSTRSYEIGNSTGTSDSADFIVKVKRKPGTAPTCSSYTLFMKNGG